MPFSHPQPAPIIVLNLDEVETILVGLSQLAARSLPEMAASCGHAWFENAALRARADATEREYAVLINAYLRELTTREKGRSL